MELWDIYDEFRNPKGYVHERGKHIERGDYHLVVHVWIVNDKGEYLIQRRQPWKHGWPNMWDCAAGGSALIKENTKEASIREVKEEIGVDLDEKNMEKLFSLKFTKGFDDVWFVKQNVDIDKISLQYEEVAEVKWAKKEEIKKMVQEGSFIPFKYLDTLFEIIQSNLEIKKANKSEWKELLELQRKVFMPLYEKYEDKETSPVFELEEHFKERFDSGDYYKILYNKELLIGGINVKAIEPGKMKLRIINILKEYENKKIGQEVVKRIEFMYPEAIEWSVITMLNEERNCHFYEKLGYTKTDNKIKVNEKMTLIEYIKKDNINKLEPLNK